MEDGIKGSVGSVAAEREMWLLMVVCLVMKAGYKDDDMDYFYEKRLTNKGSRSATSEDVEGGEEDDWGYC
ncbi:hypothetical protein POTOM_060445 [Populus tomentosa]|uniref:Uncharacterized protein n=1 Tax=Populus tomentosa TaxID=118781 RepID=A0A8X7XUM4_POPTO|nr:hypothetical protein POTOM_060445 [Populus tomentosa]